MSKKKNLIKEKEIIKNIIPALTELLEQIKSESVGHGLSAFDVFELECPNPMAFGLNGYVVLPKEISVDYLSEFYRDLDFSPVWGLTFGGYAWKDRQGVFHLIRLEQGSWATYLNEGGWISVTIPKEVQVLIEEIKQLCVPVVGFSDDHITPADLNGKVGAEYVARIIKGKIEGEMNG